MADHIRINKAEGTWTVRAGGAVMGETDNALVLEEGDYPPVIYFPRDDIAMAFLDASDKRTTSPLKGEASYYSIVTESLTIRDAAWSYEAPKDDVSEIAGRLAFMGDDVAVERV